ncbi:lipoprotein BA_5634 family protein [Clostridium weizhouense]|uniref:Uncharacterized protein n=1 Tax=Clostridium weizhouense TaxID=2859781 RepID=A0ABS7ASD6_9CLOT|nr:lipoprotein BA_5634 family protein [Clostridium weizhouense]MBW6411592.1 hypothetical protein [Clostridium weizhouense]
MKKISKWIIGGIVLSTIFVSASQGLQYYLKGPKMPINAILVSGNSKDVNQAKEFYKGNTKYTKDYKFKQIVEEKKEVADNGEEITMTNKKILLTKSTVKEMIKDQLFRIRNAEDSGIHTELLTEMPNIDSDKSIILGSDYYKSINKIDVSGVEIPVEYGCYSWFGYLPQEAERIIVDDKTYKSIEGKEVDMSLIRFKKSNLDLRNMKDQLKIKNELSDVSDNIDVNYALIKD